MNTEYVLIIKSQTALLRSKIIYTYKSNLSKREKKKKENKCGSPSEAFVAPGAMTVDFGGDMPPMWEGSGLMKGGTAVVAMRCPKG